MEKFRYLYSTIFNEKKFCVLVNRQYGIYILEILPNGELSYPQYEDYIGFYKKFQKSINNELMYNIENGSGFSNEGEVNNPKIKHKWISCIPKVIKNNALISVALALILAGYAVLSNYSYLIGDIIPGTAIEQREERAKKDGWDVEYNEKLQEYLLKSYIDPRTKEKIIVCTTNDELKSYFPEKKQNPTYEDVRDAIFKNDNIPFGYKLRYCNALNEMEEKMPDIDLFTLYLNAERIVVEKKEKILGQPYAGGSYDKNTGVITYASTDKRTVVHEFLGHALLSGRFETEDGRIVDKYFMAPICLIQYLSKEEADCYSIVPVGRMTEEYVASEIASIVIGQKLPSDNLYAPTNWHIGMYSLACEMGVEGLISEGVTGFANRMYECDIDRPAGCLFLEDILYSKHEGYGYNPNSTQDGITMDGLPKEFFIDWSKEKLERGEEGVIEKAIWCIENAGYEANEEIWYLNGQNLDESEHITPQELMDIVQMELADLENTTTSSIESDLDYTR